MKTTKKISIGRGARGKKLAAESKPEPRPPAGRVPRITKLMALAIKFDQMIREGVVKDQAELARLGFVTRARVTQLMNLLNLTPAIQELLLTVQADSRGKDGLTERQIRLVVDIVDWRQQQVAWRSLAGSTVSDSG